MIGLYLYVDFEGNEVDRLEPPFLNEKQKRTNFEWGNGAAALVSPKYTNEDNCFSDMNGDFILIDGHIFLEQKKIKAKDLFEKFNLVEDLYKQLNGEYILIIKNGDAIRIISDRLGQRQHYIANKKGKMVLSPNMSYLKDLAKVQNSINENSLQTFLFFNKLRFLDETIWQDINVFPQGTLYNVTSSATKVRYWGITYGNESLSNVNELVELYKTAVDIRYQPEVAGAISLSGGLDSRTILAALPKHDNISAITIGQNKSDEVEIAKIVANSKNIPFRHYETDGDIFWRDLDFDQFTEDDIDIILQGVWRPFLKQNIEFDYLLHGLDLDVTLGGIYLQDSLFEVRTESEFKEYIKRKCLSADLSLIMELFSNSKFNIVDRLDFLIDSFVTRLEGNNFIEKFDNLIMRYSMGRVILKRYSDIRRYHDTITPMYDADFLDYIYKISIEQRMNYKMFYPFFESLDKSLFDMPYQRTGMPGSVPVEFWSQSQQIQSKQEELYRTIAFQTNGKTHVKYNKYYTNADEWLRFNNSWMQACNYLLLRRGSIITSKYLNRDVLETIITRHQKHETSYMKILMILMSAEIYLMIEDGFDIAEIKNLIYNQNI